MRCDLPWLPQKEPLICISSPYARRGALWEAHKKHFGPEGDPTILLAQGTTRDFYPPLPPVHFGDAPHLARLSPSMRAAMIDCRQSGWRVNCFDTGSGALQKSREHRAKESYNRALVGQGREWRAVTFESEGVA